MANSRKISNPMIMLASITASCTAGGKIDVTVTSPSYVRFVVPEEGRNSFCLIALEIGRVGEGGRTTPVWRITARPGTDGTRCRYEARFPEVPPDFELSIATKRLTPGDYMVFADGGLPQVSQSFSIR